VLPWETEEIYDFRIKKTFKKKAVEDLNKPFFTYSKDLDKL